MGVRIPRKNLKIFGKNAGTNQRGIFGSFADGSPTYTTDPETIQSLSAWEGGWYDAIVGGGNPTIQDMNAQLYVYAYMMASIFQDGIPAWDDATEYFIGSVVSDNLGNNFISLVDNNTNQALSDTTKWRSFQSLRITVVNPAVTPTVTVDYSDSGRCYFVTSANGAVAFTLPTAAAGFRVTIRDTSGSSETNNITVNSSGGAQIQGAASPLVLAMNKGSWTLVSDGTNWWLVDGSIPRARASAVSAGSIVMFAGSTVPQGWSACDGSQLAQATYPELFAAIGTTWATCTNPLNGSAYSAPAGGFFRLPDLSGAFVRGTGGPNSAGVTTSLAGYQGPLTARPTSSLTTGNESANHIHTTPGSAFPSGFTGVAVNNPGNNLGVQYGNGGSGQTIWAQSAPSGSQSANHTHTVTGGGDAETRPVNVGVRFIIKLWTGS